ncbi:hypothetical protein Pmani_037650 [Petrolisthes manimaculis]|uniref:Uncharacterized protein n=1 Tax=Petrolisthes manimaculis TaxID=1843537 RepID=A0AAE1NGU9_9EUCA|nr:hypothetical protein Pmani_037650 [Petrolisthes manimaculis]
MSVAQHEGVTRRLERNEPQFIFRYASRVMLCNYLLSGRSAAEWPCFVHVTVGLQHRLPSTPLTPHHSTPLHSTPLHSTPSNHLYTPPSIRLLFHPNSTPSHPPLLVPPLDSIPSTSASSTYVFYSTLAPTPLS